MSSRFVLEAVVLLASVLTPSQDSQQHKLEVLIDSQTFSLRF